MIATYNESGKAVIATRESNLEEMVFRYLKPCFAQLKNKDNPKFFINPVDSNGNLLKIQSTPALYREMSGGSKLTPGHKDYTALPGAVFRLLLKNDVAQHCDVANIMEVRHRLDVKGMEKVRQFTVVDVKPSETHPGTRWITRMPLYIDENSGVPFTERHALRLLRTLDEHSEFVQGGRYGDFEFEGFSTDNEFPGMLFTWMAGNAPVAP